MSITLREMTIQDYPEVLALWKATPGMGLSAADTRESIASYLLRNPTLSFVAHDGARLIGAVLCGHDGRRGFIHHLAIAESHRRRGLGKMMIDHCLDALHAFGVQKCHIFVYADNREGQTFWKATGWVQRHDLLIYSKDIPHAP